MVKVERDMFKLEIIIIIIINGQEVHVRSYSHLIWLKIF